MNYLLLFSQICLIVNEQILLVKCSHTNNISMKYFELDGVKRYDINPPFMRVTYPGVYANHLRSSSRNELLCINGYGK